MKNNICKKITSYIISLFIFSAFSFMACTNIADNVTNSQTEASENSEASSIRKTGKVKFTGIINIEGASPVSLEDINNSTSGENSRYASPYIAGTFTHYAIATCGNQTINVSDNEISSNGGNTTFEISLDYGNWNIEVGIKDSSDNKILIDNYTVPVTEDNPAITHNFVLKANTALTGNGTVNLSMTIPDSVTYVSVECRSASWPNELRTAVISDGTATLNSSSVPVGNYNIEIRFYDVENGIILYRTRNIPVCVIRTFETQNWGENSSDGVITNGVFNLTAALLEEFSRTQVYVSSNGNDSTANGSRYSPYSSLQNAVRKIEKQGQNTDYTLWIDGEVTGTNSMAELSSALNTKATSITICGVAQNSSDKLNASQQGRVLKINTSIPVTIQNLTITGGSANGNTDEAKKGGGIYIASGSTVFLESGAVIGGTSGSTAASSSSACANFALLGGGIYNEGTLTLKDGSSVTYNYANDPSTNSINAGGGGILCNGGTLTIQNGARVSLNGALNRGGGIGLNGATFSMTGGEISGNKSNIWGGGIHVGNATASVSFVMSGGRITGNSATVNTTGSGGGIFYDGINSFVIKDDALIDNNSSTIEGAGVRINNGTLEMQGGEISGNYTTGSIAVGSNIENRPGGAVAVIDSGVFKMSGSAYIPYGRTVNGNLQTGAGKNDVYLVNEKTITLEDDLSSSSNSSSNKVYISATLNRGTKLLTKTSSLSELTEEIINKFALTTTDDSWEMIRSAALVTINSPFYIGKYNNTTGADVDTEGAGTKTKPYKSIEYACSKMDNKDVDYIIKIIGNTKDNGNQQQKIPSSLTNDNTGLYHAKSIEIIGFDSNAVIDRGLSSATSGSSDGNALLIESKVPVYFSNITITGGYSNASGGGININESNAKVYIQSDVKIESNKAQVSGGGIYNKGTLYISDGEIKSNSATNNQGVGGGLYNDGTVEITGGSITANNAWKGGAIAANTANTKLSGDASVVKGAGSGSDPLNDIYVTASGSLAIPDDLSKHNNSNKKIALKTEKHKGDTVLSGNRVSNNYDKFDVAPAGYSLENSGKLKLKSIVTSIYVKEGTAQNPVTDPSGNTKDASTWNNLDSYSYNASTSNSSKPFATIEKALQFITYQNTNTAYTIYIEGTISGQQNFTSNNNNTNNSVKLIKGTNASSITVTGNRSLSNGKPQDTINGNISSNIDNGYAISVTTDVPITFKKIIITGGKTLNYGGGINVSSSSDVTIDEYAFIQENNAKWGGGICNYGTLTVKKDSKINNNTIYTSGNGNNKGGAGIYNSGANAVVNLLGGEIYANSASGSNYGGGIYNAGGLVFVTGETKIGTIAKNAANKDTEYGNTGYGGGIYNTGYVYLGYKSANTNKTPKDVQEWSGYIQYNTGLGGAGIYNAQNAYVYMNSGTIYKNKASGNQNKGLGVYTNGSFIMTGGLITENVDTNDSGMGAGVYIDSSGTFDISGTSTSQRGVVSKNYVKSFGNSNLGSGGAIYNAGTLKVSGYASIPDGASYKIGNDPVVNGNGEHFNDIYLPVVQVNSTMVQKTITVGALSGNATVGNITLPEYVRGTAILDADSSLSDITNYKGRFVLNSENSKWNKEVYSNKKKVCINAPIYVKADNQVSGTKNGLSGNEVSISRAKTLIKESKITTLNHEIIIDGEISSFTLEGGNNSLDGKAASITIKGKSSTYGTDKIKGSGTAADGNVALVIKTSVPVTLQNITVTGGNNSYTYNISNTMGGGIHIGNGARVTLGDGVNVTGNYASVGAGIYNTGTLTVTGSGTNNNKRCIIDNNDTKNIAGDSNGCRGGGIYNNGTLYLEGYAKLSNNYAFNQGGAIYQYNTLYMKGFVEFSDQAPGKQHNDIFIPNGYKIQLDEALWSDLGSIKITSQYRNEGTVLIEDVTASGLGNSFRPFCFEMTTPDSIVEETRKGVLALGLIVRGSDDMPDAVARVTQDGDLIIYESAYMLADTGKEAINNSTYKIHLDVRNYRLQGYDTLSLTGFSKIQELTTKTTQFTTARVIENCPDLQTINIYGSTSRASCPNGFGQTNMILNCASLQNIVFKDATSVYLENGLLNIWKTPATDATQRNINNGVINVYIPTTVTSIEIQDRFDEIGDTFDPFDHVKFIYQGTAAQLAGVTIKRAHTTDTITTWNEVKGGVKIYYNGTTSNYKTWTPAANSPNGTLQ